MLIKGSIFIYFKIFALSSVVYASPAHFLTKSARTFGIDEKTVIRNPRLAVLGQRQMCEKWQWPEGRYALPKSQGECPNWPVTEYWHRGWRYQDTNDLRKFNSRSKSFHLDTIVTSEGILHHFCVKNHTTGCGEWPPGKYCLYRVGGRCPQSMNDGFITWDDEDVNNLNDYAGQIPDGVYSKDTQIYFCCRDDGYQNHPLILPNLLSFFLFPSTRNVCPNVFGMDSQLEYIQFSLPPTPSPVSLVGSYPYIEIDDKTAAMKLFYCYFSPTKANLPVDFKHPTKSPNTVTKPALHKPKLPESHRKENISTNMVDEMQKEVDLSSQQNLIDNKSVSLLVGGIVTFSVAVFALVAIIVIKCRRRIETPDKKSIYAELTKPNIPPGPTPSPKHRASPISKCVPDSKFLDNLMYQHENNEGSMLKNDCKNGKQEEGNVTVPKTKSSDDIIKEEQPVEDGFVEKPSYHSNISQELHLLHYRNLTDKSKEKVVENDRNSSNRQFKAKRQIIVKPVEKGKPSNSNRNKI